jgi:S-methylmethionine-dependent homocysteine/selenocysteine methylase
MSKYRDSLPMLTGAPFLSDGGLETTLMFHEGLELPHLAAFHLLRDMAAVQAMRRYYRQHAGIARAHGTGFILETNTWRASPDWGRRLGYTDEALAAANRAAVALVGGIRDELEVPGAPLVISGAIGPRGDGYAAGELMGSDEARDYHRWQLGVFVGTVVDVVTAHTMTNAPEAAGIALAARDLGLPVVISFTVETDGRLPSGQPLGDAIAEVDAASAATPAYYMINCAHPSHFSDVLEDAAWMRRLRGIRANASKRSHAELDESLELDIGNPAELGADYAELRRRFPWINVLGGCCGTDHRHIEAIGRACLGEAQAA